VLLENVAIANFRNYRALTPVPLAGESVFVVGENAGGKTSLLTATARALGRDVRFHRADFADLEQPIEIIVTLSSLGANASAEFADYIEFGAEPTLTVRVRAVWNEGSERADIDIGFPERDWRGAAGAALRDFLPLIWLPSWRDPYRMLRFGARGSLLDALFQADELTEALANAVEAMREAGDALAGEEPIQRQLGAAREKLAAVLPEIPDEAFSVGLGDVTDRDVLRQLELSIAHRDELEHFSRQSGGIQQLAMLTLSLQVAASTTDALLLVDEPETSLHPHSQRAFVALVRGLEAQSVIATHSSNVLDLADPRMVLRLKEEEAAIVPRRPTDLSNDEARRLSLLSTPETSESYFSRKTIFVEGTSDRLVLLALARKQGRNFDAEAVSIVVLHGSGQLKTHLKILGPAGLDVNLGGLCDAHDEEAWRNALEDAHIGSDLDRQGAEEIGFFVCDPDLEGELIAAVGEGVVEELIDAEGETAAWEAFRAQPDSQGQGKADLLRAFIHKRKRVMRYSPLIVNRLDETDVPAPIRGVLEHV
jgi:ABC-type cobalamin/Fe3+-siderophores transport system ATPase subunit